MGAETSRRLQSERVEQAAGEGRVDDVSKLSTHFTSDVDKLGVALDLACRFGRLNVVTWLVEHTVVRDDGDRSGKALVSACELGQLNVVTWLVEHTVLRDGGYWLREALVTACEYSRWKIVKWLLKNTQAEVSEEDYFTGNNNILHLVISYNADKSRILNSRLVLDMTEMCRLVYVCGENVNEQDSNTGETPLHTACDEYNSDKVGALLLAGADDTITNDRGQTPVQLAVRNSLVKVLPLLDVSRLWKLLELLDVSSKWKLLVRSHRLRRRTAVRVMMTLVKWKVQQTRNMWTRAVMTLHTIITCTVYTYRHNHQRMYTPRLYTRLRMDDSVEAVFSADGTPGFRNNSNFDVDSATDESRVETSDSDTLVTIVNMLLHE